MWTQGSGFALDATCCIPGLSLSGNLVVVAGRMVSVRSVLCLPTLKKTVDQPRMLHKLRKGTRNVVGNG